MESLAQTVPLRDSSSCRGKSEELRYQAQTDGYLYLKQVFDPECVFRVRRTVLDLCQQHGWLDEGADVMQGIAQEGLQLGAYNDARWHAFLRDILVHPEFLTLAAQPALLSILESILGVVPELDGGHICRVVSPETTEFSTKPHQEREYIKSSTNLWIAWIPLGDCPIALGGLSLIPGSHQYGLLPHTGIEDMRWIHEVEAEWTWATSPMKCGDVLLLHNLTVHQALDNRSVNRLRLSADFRFTPKMNHFFS